MKMQLQFHQSDIDSVGAILARGIHAYATNARLTGGMINVIWCFMCDGSVLRIQSKMNDLAEREEVGTLVFRLVSQHEQPIDPIELPDSWRDITSAEMLVIEESEFSAESGLVITNRTGEELIIVCGADICAVQIKAPFFKGDFLPEYDLEKYVRYPLRNSTGS